MEENNNKIQAELILTHEVIHTIPKMDNIIEIDGNIYLLQNENSPQPTIESPSPIITNDI